MLKLKKMTKIEGCLLIIGIGILSVVSGLRAKDRYFKGQYIVLGIVLIIGAILSLISSLPSSASKGHRSSADSVVEKKSLSTTNGDSAIKEGAKIRFIPARDLPIPKK